MMLKNYFFLCYLCHKVGNDGYLFKVLIFIVNTSYKWKSSQIDTIDLYSNKRSIKHFSNQKAKPNQTCLKSNWLCLYDQLYAN